MITDIPAHCATPELAAARARIAERYAHDYLKRAILNGDWDRGELVQDALSRELEIANIGDASDNNVTLEEQSA